MNKLQQCPIPECSIYLLKGDKHLVNHMNSDHRSPKNPDLGKFECTICNTFYRTKWSAKRHYLIIHQVDTPILSVNVTPNLSTGNKTINHNNNKGKTGVASIKNAKITKHNYVHFDTRTGLLIKLKHLSTAYNNINITPMQFRITHQCNPCSDRIPIIRKYEGSPESERMHIESTIDANDTPSHHIHSENTTNHQQHKDQTIE